MMLHQRVRSTYILELQVVLVVGRVLLDLEGGGRVCLGDRTFRYIVRQVLAKSVRISANSGFPQLRRAKTTDGLCVVGIYTHTCLSPPTLYKLVYLTLSLLYYLSFSFFFPWPAYVTEGGY